MDEVTVNLVPRFGRPAACLVYHRLPKWPKYDFFNIHEKSISTKSTNFDIPKNESTGGGCQGGSFK